MGQVSTPVALPSIILSATDRLVARNSDGGLAPAASHVILLGERAGRNLGALSNIILLGADTGSGGLSSLAASGTVVIGGQSLKSLSASGANGPMTLLGYNNLPLVTTATLAQMQAFGDNIAENLVGGATTQDSILIGSHVLGRLGLGNAGVASCDQNVVIGTYAGRGVLGGDARNFSSNVAIGWQAMELWGSTAGGEPDANVCVGRQAGRNLGQTLQAISNVCVGDQSGKAVTNGNRNTLIGASTDLNGPRDDNTCVGFNAGGGQISGNKNTVIGAGNTRAITARNVLLGYDIANDCSDALSDFLAIGTNDGVTIRMAIYGDLGTGSMVLGRSTGGVNRDLPGTNLLKLLNGTATGTPVGGGMLRSDTGLPVWRDSAGVDYQLAGNGFLGTFTVAALPVAPRTGTTAYASDALAPAFGAPVAGVGAVFVPVFYNGATWIVG